MDVRIAGGIMGGMLLLLVTTLFLLIRWAKRRRRRQRQNPAGRGAVALGKHLKVVRAAPCTHNTHTTVYTHTHTHTHRGNYSPHTSEKYILKAHLLASGDCMNE